MQYSSVYTRMP